MGFLPFRLLCMSSGGGALFRDDFATTQNTARLLLLSLIVIFPRRDTVQAIGRIMPH